MKEKVSDLQLVKLGLTAEHVYIGSKNSLFKEISKEQIPRFN